MRTKEDIQKEQAEMRAKTQQMKKDLKLEKQQVKVLEKVAQVEKKRFYLEKETKHFDGKRALSDMVANSSANNFTKYNFDKIDKGVKENLEENEFFIQWNRALYIASMHGFAGISSYIGKDKRAKVIAGELSDIVFEDTELLSCTISITHNPILQSVTMLKWEKKGKAVYVSKWDKAIVSTNETKQFKTTFDRIPVAIVFNNALGKSDIAYSEHLMDIYSQVIDKMKEDIDFGGNKLAVAENILPAFGKGTIEEQVDKVRERFEKSVLVVPTAKVQSLNNNIPSYEISSQPFYNDNLKGYLETVRGEIYKFSGLHESKGKNSAQETDSQVQNNNKQQNDSIETKKVLREIALKGVVLNHSIVMQASADSAKLYKNITEIDLEIELSSNQEQQLMNEKGENKDGKDNDPRAVRPNSK